MIWRIYLLKSLNYYLIKLMETKEVLVVVFVLIITVAFILFLYAVLRAEKKNKPNTIALIKKTTRKNEVFYFIEVNGNYQGNTVTMSYEEALEIFEIYCETGGKDTYETIKTCTK